MASPLTSTDAPPLSLSGDYLDRLMRRESFSALWPLFAKATKPAKEMTESFSALVHLRSLMKRVDACRVLHVGDGAHARSAALFSLKTAAHNISIDPLINEPLVSAWRDEFNIQRFEWRKGRLEDHAAELNELPELPVFVTFVHAHVHVDLELSRLRWDAAYTLACCYPTRQLTQQFTPYRSGTDLNVLSVGRDFQLLINPQSARARLLMGVR